MLWTILRYSVAIFLYKPRKTKRTFNHDDLSPEKMKSGSENKTSKPAVPYSKVPSQAEGMYENPRLVGRHWRRQSHVELPALEAEVLLVDRKLTQLEIKSFRAKDKIFSLMNTTHFFSGVEPPL